MPVPLHPSHHADWLPRYERYNRPGDYHNGGVWLFICGFYIAACVVAGKMDSRANRPAQWLRLADLVGSDVSICRGVRAPEEHTIL
jgi:hypothetical protein